MREKVHAITKKNDNMRQQQKKNICIFFCGHKRKKRKTLKKQTKFLHTKHKKRRRQTETEQANACILTGCTKRERNTENDREAELQHGHRYKILIQSTHSLYTAQCIYILAYQYENVQLSRNNNKCNEHSIWKKSNAYHACNATTNKQTNNKTGKQTNKADEQM